MSLRLILIQAPPPKVTAYLLPLAALRAGGAPRSRRRSVIESGEVSRLKPAAPPAASSYRTRSNRRWALRAIASILGPLEPQRKYAR